MDVLRPLGRWLIGVCWVVFLPVTGFGAWGERSLPDGVCGSPQAMLEAAQAGNAMVQQALAAGMPWGDKSLNEYVNRLGQNLARSSGSQQVFSFYILYNPVVNAQSFSGGYIVINSGVISLAESESELAYVLSHEIAHVNSCDWRTATWKGNLFELISLVPAVVLAGPAGIALTSGSGWAATVARARSSRAGEQRADRLAAQYLVRAGYDPQVAARFFRHLQEEQVRSGGEPGGLLATHPRTVDRQRKLEKIIPHLPPPEFAPHDEAEFLQMRRAVREYDEIYSRAVGVRVPGHDAPPPELSRRPPAEAVGSRQWAVGSRQQAEGCKQRANPIHRPRPRHADSESQISNFISRIPNPEPRIPSPALQPFGVLARLAYNGLLPGVPCWPC